MFPWKNKKQKNKTFVLIVVCLFVSFIFACCTFFFFFLLKQFKKKKKRSCKQAQSWISLYVWRGDFPLLCSKLLKDWAFITQRSRCSMAPLFSHRCLVQRLERPLLFPATLQSAARKLRRPSDEKNLHETSRQILEAI